jgi:hypothetical protein
MLAVLLAGNTVTALAKAGQPARSGITVAADDRQTRVVKSVHVPQLFDHAVVQQPDDDDNFIANVSYQATQFSLAG